MDHVAQREGGSRRRGMAGEGGAAPAASQEALAVIAVPSQLLRQSNFGSGKIAKKIRKFTKDLLLRADEAFLILECSQMYKG